MDLRVQVEPPHRVLTLTLAGELDAATAGEITEAAAAFTATRFSVVILDLAGVSFCDGAGLGSILALRQLITTAGGALRLQHPPKQLRRLMHLSGCHDLLGPEPGKPNLRLIHGTAV